MTTTTSFRNRIQLQILLVVTFELLFRRFRRRRRRRRRRCCRRRRQFPPLGVAVVIFGVVWPPAKKVFFCRIRNELSWKKNEKMIFFIAAGDFCKRCESGSMSVGGADDDVIVVELIGKKIEQYKIRNSSQSLFVLSQ